MIGSQPLCTTPSRGPHTIVSGGCEGVVIGLWFYHFRGQGGGFEVGWLQ
jgi:hypothetical protein